VVAAGCVLRGRIPGSDTGELSLPITQVWQVRDGRVVEVREYRTMDEARAAMG
jgi:ketosteroid isomerase-like protein